MLAFLPQVVAVVRTGDSASMKMNIRTFVTHSVGVGLWTCYGIMKSDHLVSLFNLVTLVLCLVVIVAFAYHKAFSPEDKLTITREQVV
jgi:uncharacterized protein with PQ loop repeat